MLWDEWGNPFQEQQQQFEDEEEKESEEQQEENQGESFLNFDFFSVLSKPKVF